MKETELHLKDGRTAGIWFCGECRIVHRTQADAANCCKPKMCEACSVLPVKQYHSKCDSCRDLALEQKEKERFSAAEKVTAWDGWVYCEGFGRDGYCENIEELLQEIEDEGAETPAYVYTCDPKQFVCASADDITDRILDNAWEDFEIADLKGLEALKKALDEFNEANAGLVVYNENRNRVLLLKAALAAKESQ